MKLNRSGFVILPFLIVGLLISGGTIVGFSKVANYLEKQPVNEKGQAVFPKPEDKKDKFMCKHLDFCW